MSIGRGESLERRQPTPGSPTVSPNIASSSVELASRWVPYGAVPEEDIFIKFGIPESEFYLRVATHLKFGGLRLDPHRRQQILIMCQKHVGEIVLPPEKGGPRPNSPDSQLP